MVKLTYKYKFSYGDVKNIDFSEHETTAIPEMFRRPIIKEVKSSVIPPIGTILKFDYSIVGKEYYVKEIHHNVRSKKSGYEIIVGIRNKS